MFHLFNSFTIILVDCWVDWDILGDLHFEVSSFVLQYTSKVYPGIEVYKPVVWIVHHHHHHQRRRRRVVDWVLPKASLIHYFRMRIDDENDEKRRWREERESDCCFTEHTMRYSKECQAIQRKNIVISDIDLSWFKLGALTPHDSFISFLSSWRARKHTFK